MNERFTPTILEQTPLRRAALLAAGAILAVTGCTTSSDSPVAPNPSTTVEQVPRTPEITREQLTQDPRLLAKTHDTLPPKVQEAASGTVRLLNYTQAEIEYTNADNKVQYSELGSYVPGSGSVVKSGNKNMILTAGHVVEKTDEHCGTEEVHYQSENGVLGGVASQHGDFSSTLYLGRKPDIALLAPKSTAERQNNGQSEPAMPLRQNVSAVTGDEVFIAGWPAPIEGEEQRDPSNYGNDGNPNIHNSLLLGETNGYLVILDGSGKSFAAGSTSHITRPGNSGGPVIDKDGYQIGVISGSFLRPSSTQETARSFGVNIDNPEDYILTFAQIVDQGSVDKLADNALSAPACTDLPTQRIPIQ